MSLPAPLLLAEYGYHVFPCQPNGKQPATPHGVKDATTDAAQIEAWLEQMPDANWAIACDGLYVIDIDGPANAWLADQSDKLLDLAAGQITLTPSGGRHYFTRQPAGASLGNTCQKIAPKVDTRANGGYVVCAPSKIGDKSYRWAAIDGPVPLAELPETPAWLLAALSDQPQRAALPATGNMIPAGQRNSALASLAGSMRNRGMTVEEIAAALLVANANRCQPPLSPDEVETIAASIARYEPKAPPEQQPAGLSRPILVNLADVTPKPVDWLWPGRIPLGKITLIAGEPGQGKSSVSMDIASRVTTGAQWPDGQANQAAPVLMAKPGSVVLLTAEDDIEDTIRPRLDAAGADVRQVTALKGIEYETGKRRCFNLEHDLSALEQAIQARPDCRLVVIDPVSSYLGKNDSHVNAEMRGLLEPLTDLAARHCVAVVIITHLAKGQNRKAINAVIGSIAFVGLARASWMVVADRNDKERRLFLPIKNSLTKDQGGLAFRIVDRQVHGQTVGAVEWEPGTVDLSADEALSDEPAKRGSPAVDECCHWLLDKFQGGAKLPAEEIYEEGQGAFCFSRSTIKNAKTKLGIIATKEGFGDSGRWVWALPGSSLSGETSPTVAA